MSIDETEKTPVDNAERVQWTEGLNHIALQVRDIDEATTFWRKIFNAVPYRDDEIGKRVRHILVVDTVLFFSENPGLVGWELEYPHYGFTVTSKNMYSLKSRLETAGVRTHPLWTRNEVEGLMYFRDPSGNLFELYCPQLDGADDRDRTLLAKTFGGDFVPPFADLHYEWDVAQAEALPVSEGGRDCLVGLNHMTLPVRDSDEAVRFWTEIFGAKIFKYLHGRPSHLKFGSKFVLHFGGGEGLVGSELEFPHYAFTVTSDKMFALKSRLDAAGVVTHPIWTRSQVEGLMYFRDPTGNLFELYCPELEGADDPTRVLTANKYEGTFTPPVAQLAYDWKG